LGGKRCSRVTRLRKYSTLKRYPKRPRVIIKEDLGDAELIETISFPQVEHVKTVIPKEKNPNLVWILRSPVHIGYYKDKGVAYIYDENNRFLGSLDLLDLWLIYQRISDILSRSETQSKSRIRRESENDIDMGG
jgi:hypothetical protein